MTTIINDAEFAIRRDLAANWMAVNPTLPEGVEGYETDTGMRKVGHGGLAWSALPYVPLTSQSDVTLLGTSRRFLADFTSSALGALGTFFQTTVANSLTALRVKPSGTATDAFVQLFSSSAPDVCQVLTLHLSATQASLESSSLHGGAYVPLRFSTSDIYRLDILVNGMIVMSALPALNFANDAAAATGGVPVGGLYNTSGAVKVRVT